MFLCLCLPHSLLTTYFPPTLHADIPHTWGQAGKHFKEAATVYISLERRRRRDRGTKWKRQTNTERWDGWVVRQPWGSDNCQITVPGGVRYGDVAPGRWTEKPKSWPRQRDVASYCPASLMLITTADPGRSWNFECVMRWPHNSSRGKATFSDHCIKIRHQTITCRVVKQGDWSFFLFLYVSNANTLWSWYLKPSSTTVSKLEWKWCVCARVYQCRCAVLSIYIIKRLTDVISFICSYTTSVLACYSDNQEKQRNFFFNSNKQDSGIELTTSEQQ